MAELAWALGALAALFALLDGWYLLRVPATLLLYGRRWGLPGRGGGGAREPRLEEESSFPSRVLPSDLDCLAHMNNARYPREADLARLAHVARGGLLRALRALGAHAVLAAATCRYRRPLRLLERFDVRTRLLGWDARAFLLEQRFVRARDGFLCAVLHVRMHVVGASPAQAVERLCGRKVESPELPEDIVHWLKYNEVSSQKLRAESDLQESNKEQ